MDPYFKKYFFIEEIVINPAFLDANLFSKLKETLALKYPKTYQNKGYIFNIEIAQILDNRITLTGQIILKVNFCVDLYIPKVGHVFQSTVKRSTVNKYAWIEVWSNAFEKREGMNMTIFLYTNSEDIFEDGQPVTVEIINVKPDNTLCFGKIIN